MTTEDDNVNDSGNDRGLLDDSAPSAATWFCLGAATAVVSAAVVRETSLNARSDHG